jgi:hypothetical protein
MASSSYKPLFEAPTDTDDDQPTAASIPLEQLASSPTQRRHHYHHAKDSSEEQNYSDDEDEVLALMARGSRDKERGDEQDKSHANRDSSEAEGPLYKDEDLDIDSAMAMVRKVSLLLLCCSPTAPGRGPS